MVDEPVEQADVRVLFLHQTLAEHVPERQCAQRPDRIHEQRVRAVEGVDEAAVGQRRPAPRLNGAAHLERQLVEPELPRVGLDPFLARQPSQIPVGAHVVEAVIVHAHVGEVDRHPLQRPLAPEIEKLLVAGGVELEERRSELEPLRPFSPAASLIASFDGEHRRAVFRPPGVFDG
jgi:hypothetical protein